MSATLPTSTSVSAPASALAPRLTAYFNEYASFHRTPGNQISHYLGIPVLVVATLGLLGQVTFGQPVDWGVVRLDAGSLLWAAAAAFYLLLDWRIALPFSALVFGTYLLGRSLPMDMLWSLFAAGWVLQLVGHYHFEKRSPAFLKNFEHILIGPLWVFAKWIGYA